MNPSTKPVDPAKAKEFFGNKLSFTTGPVEVDHMMKAHDNINVIDVRAEDDYQKGHVPGSINLPKDKWHTLEGLSKDKTNIIYCYSAVCHLAATAAYKFAERGYPVMEMDGGFDEWKEHGLEIETGANRGVSLNA
ncbi:MAG TPA: rhodanese-like domain-containing protein [Verrucomicrobiae bacterium]|nr:rhodanese-like domain-containing protein [Verrucomicrobiae bacterium]